MTRDTVMCYLELIPLRGEKHFKPPPQGRILVPLGVLFKISDEHPCPFYMGVPPFLLGQG